MPIIRYYSRRDCFTVEKIDQAINEEERRRILSDYLLSKNLSLKLNTDPGFLQHVTNQVRNLGWARQHRRELAYLIMLDVLSTKQTSVRESEYEEGLDELTSRTRQSIRHEYYPEIFFRPPARLFVRKVDKRIHSYKTVFTDAPEFDEETLMKAATLGYMADQPILPHLKSIDKMMEWHTGLRLVNPHELEDIRVFGDELIDAIDRVNKKSTGLDSERLSLVEEIRGRTRIVEELKITLDSAIQHYWFTKKTEKQRREMLRHHFELQYSHDDAKKAVEENMAYFEDPPMVCDYFSRGAQSFMTIGRFDVAVWLYEECSQRKEVDDIDRGLALHNKASVYLSWEKPVKYLHALEDELDFWKGVKREIDVGITHAYIAEAHALLGSKTKSDLHFGEAFMILNGLKSSNFNYMKAWYYVADCAERVNRIDLEVKALSRSLEASPEHDPQWTSYLNQRLEDALHGRKTSKSMSLPGKPARPPEYLYQKIADAYHPVSPSKHISELYEKLEKTGKNV